MSKIVLLVLIVAASCFAGPSKTLPQFAFKDIDGIVVNSDEFKGKVLILDFWATWCLSCKKAYPVLNELSEKYGAQGLEVIGLNTDKKKTPQQIIEYLIKNNVGYRTLMAGQSSRLAEQLEVFSMPMIYLFDRNGKLITQVIGFEADDKAQLLKAVKKVMK